MRLAMLFPHLRGLRLERIGGDDHHRLLTVAVTRQHACCPLCGRRSDRVPSRYERTLADVPIGGRAVLLRVGVRRCRCAHRPCAHRIFAERLPQLSAARARRTQLQRLLLEEVASTAGGAPGARLAARLRVPASRATLLRLLRAAPLPQAAPPRVLGVDDWAWRRGRTYGSLLVDLEARRPVDLLPDRTAATFAAWLQAHPGVAVISRDRGGASAEGGRLGAPDAIQVADRWRLLANAGDVLERILRRKAPQRQAAAAAVDQQALAAVPITGDRPAMAELAEAPAPRRLTRAEPERQTRRAQRLARSEAVVALHGQGWSQCAIADEVGLGRKTVRRYLRAEAFPEVATRRPRPTLLTPYVPYLLQRWTEGCHNARLLCEELVRQGFPGAASLVRRHVRHRRHVRQWRTAPARRGRAAQRPVPGAAPPPAPPTPVLSPRAARWLLLRPWDDLEPAEQAHRTALLGTCAELVAAHGLVQEFGRLVRERDPAAFAGWLSGAEASAIPEVRAFAAGIRRDQAAVEAALCFEWSNGQTEGQINRLNNVSSDDSDGSFPSVVERIGLPSLVDLGEVECRDEGVGEDDERRLQRPRGGHLLGPVPGGSRHRTGAGVHPSPVPVVPTPQDRGRLGAQPRSFPGLLRRCALRAMDRG
ncbi:MAG: ISL3 family transposase [Chloroflexi bacterium]|nr:ISL3 family transposase [Chloroflexota bacterium]